MNRVVGRLSEVDALKSRDDLIRVVIQMDEWEKSMCCHLSNVEIRTIRDFLDNLLVVSDSCHESHSLAVIFCILINHVKARSKSREKK
jgi:hypothetical protein